MSDKKSKNDKVKLIIKDLFSNDDKTVIKSLKAIKTHGNDELISPLLDLWNSGVSEKIEKEIINLLFEIKSSSTTTPIMEVLSNPDYEKIHLSLLTTIWNSKVDYSEYLSDFVSIAVANDFNYALECLTIIENLDGPFEENHLFDAQIILREYAESQSKKEEKDDQKNLLLKEIAAIIQAMEEGSYENDFYFEE